MALLQVNNIETYLDQFHILQGVSLAVEKEQLLYCLGEMVQGDYDITFGYGISPYCTW